jgi:antitoxin (DNA-binding transcriptional repressor) of toxin-antitoxin stability system
MKFISIRELRNSSGRLKELLRENDRLLLTSNGRPLALITAVEEDDLENEIKAISRAKAALALERTRAAARERGQDGLGMEAIDATIRQIRQARNKAASGK